MIPDTAQFYFALSAGAVIITALAYPISSWLFYPDNRRSKGDES